MFIAEDIDVATETVFDPGNDPFAQWLQGELTRRNWSYNDVAIRAGTRKNMVFYWLKTGQEPNVLSIIRLSNAFDVEPQFIFNLLLKRYE